MQRWSLWRKGKETRYYKVYADTWDHCCQIFRELLVGSFYFCGRGSHIGFWAWNGWGVFSSFAVRASGGSAVLNLQGDSDFMENLLFGNLS